MKSSLLPCLPGSSQLARRVYAAAIDSDFGSAQPQALQSRSFFGDAPIVRVIWEKNLKTGGSITTLWDADMNDLHAFGCGDGANAAGVSVLVSADQEGYGSLTIGAQAYSIDFQPSDSGGVSCSRMYNDEHAVAECTVPAASFSILPSLPHNITAGCHAATQLVEDGLATIPIEDQEVDVVEDIEGGELHLVSESTVAGPEDIFSPVSKRQQSGLCANIKCRYYAGIITNPWDPETYCCRSFRHRDRAHIKWRRFAQMQSLPCRFWHLPIGIVPCFVTFTGTATHEARFYAPPKGALRHTDGEWTYGDLKVKRVHTATANDFRCQAHQYTDTVCVGNTHTYQAYDIYTAYFHHVWADDTGFYELRSPLTDAGQNKFYCRVNDCGPANHVSWSRVGTGIWEAAR